MNSRASKYVSCVFTLAFAALIPITLAAQVKAAATGRAPWDNSGSKWNIFMGYSYLDPNGKIAGAQSGAPGSTYGQINYGAIFSAARYFNRNLGVQIEADEHIQSEDWPLGLPGRGPHWPVPPVLLPRTICSSCSCCPA